MRRKYLYEEIYDYIKRILDEPNIKEDDKLPSKRQLSEMFSASPLTVDKAYNLLIDEGMVYAVEKKGYFVGPKIEGFQKTTITSPIIDMDIKTTADYDFGTYAVDTAHFPHQTWAKLTRTVLAEQNEQLLNETHPLGLYELRAEIQKHLSVSRGIHVSPDQIIIGSSSTQILNVIIDLLGRDHHYAIEDPSYPQIYHFFQSQNIKMDLVPVETDGLNLEVLRESQANIVYAVPSHQFPSGAIMTMQKRKDLLAWAYETNDRYVIEDDYDSEFRYEGRPLQSLKGMDRFDRVIYTNTFSKSLAPAFRVAYLVLPISLMRQFHDTSMYYRCTVPNLEQFVLSKFMSENYFQRHLRRMRKLYLEKLNYMKALTLTVPHLKMKHDGTGLHFLLSFCSTRTEKEVIKLLKEKEIHVTGLSMYRHLENHSKTVDLLIGYAGLSLNKLKAGYPLILKTITSLIKPCEK